MNTKPGTRVCAILKMDNETVLLFGYGTYTGDEVPPKEAIGFNIGIPCPKIALDNGKTVYGCECWWSTQERVENMIGARTIVMVDIDQLRKEQPNQQ